MDPKYVLATTPDEKQRLFMVDTGASVSVISTEVAQELGLAVQPTPKENSSMAKRFRSVVPHSVVRPQPGRA